MIDRTHPASAGFTLLEILIALFIFALMVGGLLGVYRKTLTEISDLQVRTDYLESARSCMERILLDLSSLHIEQAPRYRPPLPGGTMDVHHFYADIDHRAGMTFGNLRFSSRAHLAFDAFPPGIAEVHYFADTRADGVNVLRRAQRVFPRYPRADVMQDVALHPVICEDITTLTFSFYDIQGDSHATWNSEERRTGFATPVAVDIQLGIGSNDAGRQLQTRLALPVWRRPIP